MSLDQLARLIDRTDRVLSEREASVLKTVQAAINQSFERLELELRRGYPDASESALIYRQRNAAVLLQQLRGMLSVVSPQQLQEFEAGMGELLPQVQEIALQSSGEAVRLFNAGGVTFLPRVPVEVAVVAAEQSAQRLKTHGDKFAGMASTLIAQGIFQRWGIDQTVRELRKATDIAKSNAEMIVCTETIDAYNVAAEMFYEENGIQYVMRYVTADDRTCRHCGSRVGEITRLGQEQAVLHPRCRCYFAPFDKGWVKAGRMDLAKVEEYAAQVKERNVDPKKLDPSRVAPFERSSGIQKRPQVYWRPGQDIPKELNAPQPASR